MAADPGIADAGASVGDAPLIRTDDLRVRAGRQEILKGITLEARRGEILSIIGPAGAGKTTFLRCLNRMAELDPDLKVSGKILLDGKFHLRYRAWTWLSSERQVGTVFSVPIPLPMTIYENLTFGLRLQSGSRDPI